MEDQKHLPIKEALVYKPRKKKTLSQKPEMFQSPMENVQRTNEVRTLSSQKGQKGSKRGPVNDVSPQFQHQSLIADPAQDSSASGNEYRTLRRKYLLLEEESFGLGKELKAVEDDIKSLEEEKLSLLDELVVLEGLVDPSDIQPPGHRLL